MSETETFVLQLVDQMSAQANAATASLTPLERQLLQAQKAVAGFESTAKGALDPFASGLDKTAAEMKKLDAATVQESAALQKLQSQMKAMESGSLGSTDIKQHKALQSQIDKSKSKLEGFGNQKTSLLGKQESADKKYAATQEKLQGKAGALVQKQQKIEQKAFITKGKIGLKQSKDDQKDLKEMAQALGAVGGLFTAVAAVGVGLVAAGASFAQSANDFNLDMQGALEDSYKAVLGKSDAVAGKVSAAAAAAQASVRNLSDALPASEAEIGKLAEQFIRAGVPADQLAAKITKAVEGSSKGFSSIGVVVAKFQDHMRHLFETPAVAKFNEALGKMLSMFNQESSVGKALKDTLGGMFGALFDAATAAIPYVKKAIRDITLGFLKIKIALFPAYQAIQMAFGGDAAGGFASGVLKAVDAVVSFYVFMSKVWAVLIPMIVVWAQWWVKFYGFVGDAIGAIVNFGSSVIDAIGGAASFVTDAMSGAWDAITSMFDGGDDLATNLIDGIVAGLTAGAGKVIDALTNVGKGAIDSVKGVLGIASPSKVMAQLGEHTTEGFAGGIEKGSGDTAGAMAAAVAPPTVGGGGAAAGGGGGGSKIDVGGVVIQFGGAAPSNAKELEAAVPDIVTKIFEDIALRLGGALS